MANANPSIENLEKRWSAIRARTDARIEDMEFLVSIGVPHTDAAIRAGWPSIHAAERCLDRRGRSDLARPLSVTVWQARRRGR